MVKDRVGTFSGTTVPQYRRGGCPPVLLRFFLSILPTLMAGLVCLNLIVVIGSNFFAQATEENRSAAWVAPESLGDIGLSRQPVLRIIYAANTHGVLYPCPS